MPRSIWSGAISFGLVNVPIKLVTASKSKTVGFRQIRRSDNSRIRYRKVAQADGEEVQADEIVKGYEVSPDQYVVIEPEELDALDPKATKTIDIEDFVDLSDIDPIYYDSSYYLVPGETGAKPYKLLHQAMVESNKAAVARFVLRTKQYHAIVRPYGDALAVSTLVYDDEILSVDKLDGMPSDDIEYSDKELAMAEQLIESMTTDWEPSKYTDTYREKVLDLIEKKAEGQEIVTVPDAERESGEVVDLMAALEDSLKQAKKDSKKKSKSKGDAKAS